MPQRVIRTGTVPTTTSGGPDYWPQKSRTVLGPNQTRLNISFDFDLPAGITVIAPIYTIPTGYNGMFGYMKVACDHSFIQEATMNLNAAAFCLMHYDQLCIMPLSEISGFFFNQGDVITGTFNNTSGFAVNYRGTITGFIWRI